MTQATITTPYGTFPVEVFQSGFIPWNMIVGADGSDVMAQLLANQATMIQLLQQIAGSTPTPLTLSSTQATAGQPWEAAIGGLPAGATTTAIASDGTQLTVTGQTVSGTFTNATAQPVTVNITLGQGTPHQTVVPITVSSSSGSFTPSLDFSDARNSQFLG